MPSDAPGIAISSAFEREFAGVAAAFLATLDAARLARALHSFDSPARFDWSYVPRRRPGLALAEMDSPQRAAALAMLRFALSPGGYDTATAIMALEACTADDPLDYALAIYGDPRRGAPWGWSFEGHHLSLHFTVVPRHRLAVTPAFWGAAPVRRAVDGQVHAVLAAEEEEARALMLGLEPTERTAALLADRSMGDIVTGPGREDSLRQPVGLPLARLDEARHARVIGLVRLFAFRLRPDLAEREMEHLRDAGPDRLHFAWAGGLEPGQPHYWRIHGPTLILEYDNSQDGANHIHSVWHEPDADFGRDPLLRHYAARHGSPSVSAAPRI